MSQQTQRRLKPWKSKVYGELAKAGNKHIVVHKPGKKVTLGDKAVLIDREDIHWEVEVTQVHSDGTVTAEHREGMKKASALEDLVRHGIHSGTAVLRPMAA